MFRPGDKVKIIRDGWSNTFGVNRYIVGREAIIIRKKEAHEETIHNEIHGNFTEGYWGWIIETGGYKFLIMEDDLELIKQTKTMKLNSMMRRLLNADVKKLIKAGLMNGDLLLTEEGKNAIYALLVETHKKELVEIAKEIIEEQKEDK